MIQAPKSLVRYELLLPRRLSPSFGSRCPNHSPALADVAIGAERAEVVVGRFPACRHRHGVIDVERDA
jgi:hypothetical protein